MDLKLSLIVRVAVVAALTSAGLGGYFVARSERQNREEIAGVAHVIERQVTFQLIKIATGMDLSARFPDWQPVIEHMDLKGLCIGYEDDLSANLAHAECVAADPSYPTAPAWFAALADAAFHPARPIREPVHVRGFAPGSVVVTPDRDGAIARLWYQSALMLELLLAQVGFVSLLAWLAVAGALRPTAEMTSRLARMAEGDLTVRLPTSRFGELRAIGSAVNRLAAKLQRTLADRAQLAHRLVDAHENERGALARELHDELGQCLAAINAKAALIARHAERSAPALAPEALGIGRIAATTLAQLRETLVRLRPPELDELGAVESLRRLVLSWSLSSTNGEPAGAGSPGLQCHFEATGNFDDMPTAVGVSLYRIVQECLTNVARHAAARRVDVELRRVGATIDLRVIDDGRGATLPPTQGGQSGQGGLGLVGMRERALALGGEIRWSARQPSGFEVRVRVPMDSLQLAAGAETVLAPETVPGLPA